MYSIKPEDPTSVDAAALIEALSSKLASITGDGGKSSFDAKDVRGDRALFVVARTSEGTPVGCGAFRPISEEVAEVKRMFAVPGTLGVGSAVLTHLEAAAKRLGYRELWLETRRVNEHAVMFYQRRGYRHIENFGKYVGKPEAVCFSKRLVEVD